MAVLLSGTINSVTDTPGVLVKDATNLLIVFNGADAVIQLKRSFDNGDTWHTLSINSFGDKAQYTDDINMVFDEPEQNVMYQLSCTEYKQGTIIYRISQ